MCIGEGGSDSLQASEQTFLSEAVRHRLPTYAVEVRTNDDALAWVVLEPAAIGPRMPRFTICRIDPCIMVMVEDPAARRRFSSLANVEEALAFACHTALEARLALANIHPAPEVCQ